eukprot:TRINITY_DN2630_c0_g1_i1.p1 TRINITY_DN2630_c0_g1~~TRINITY_DN2630_c0_g1_i1.p1  ORF type:complete len:682 (-),score=226.84 TRINITY_DN2630_c0_g1_i1:79-2124(-)
MKALSMALVCIAAVTMFFASPVMSVKAVHGSAGSKANGAIAEIVKQLKTMAEKSEKDGEEEEDTFKKFECYNKKLLSNTSTWIETMTDELESADISIERNSAKQAECQSKQAQLKKDIADNEATQAETTAMRNKSRAAFLAEEKDMKSALQQLGTAFEALSSNSSSSLLQVPVSENPALASLFQRLQAESKSSQSGFLAAGSAPGSASNGVVGILKSTKETYAQNLKDLQGQEEADQASHGKLMEKLQEKNTQLKEMDVAASECIDETSQQLVTERKIVKDETALLESQKTIKADLANALAQKTKSYEGRKVLRSQEDAAISKAISILNSDDALKAFNKASSSLLQVVGSAEAKLMHQNLRVLSYLRSQAHLSKSTRLAQLAVLISSEDPEKPFDRVLKEIADMKDVIDKEGASDTKKRRSCAKDISDSKEALAEQDAIITAQNTKITNTKQMLGSVEDKTGLLNDLSGESGSKAQLQASLAEQKTATESRTKENQDYQQNIADLQVAQNLIKKAMQVLKTYYAKLELVQQDSKAEPTYEAGEFSGQSAGGSGVMKLMQTMLDNTANAEAQAHKDEHAAQASFETSMQTLTASEEKMKAAIVDGKKEIAEANLALDESSKVLADAQKQKAATETYLSDIKPGCDFIASNFDKREANRVAEKESLDNALKLIKGTPAYQNSQ